MKEMEGKREREKKSSILSYASWMLAVSDVQWLRTGSGWSWEPETHHRPPTWVSGDAVSWVITMASQRLCWQETGIWSRAETGIQARHWNRDIGIPSSVLLNAHRHIFFSKFKMFYSHLDLNALKCLEVYVLRQESNLLSLFFVGEITCANLSQLTQLLKFPFIWESGIVLFLFFFSVLSELFLKRSMAKILLCYFSKCVIFMK